MPPLKLLQLAGIGLLVGAAGYLLLGQGPRGVDAGPDMAATWRVPGHAGPDIASAQAIWQQRHPWGAPAAGELAEGGPAHRDPAQPTVIGVAIEGGQPLALFVLPGQPLLRLPVGAGLPGGGEVVDVTPTAVEWTGPDGTRHRQALLAASAQRAPAQSDP